MNIAMTSPGAVPAASLSANRYLWVAVGALGATSLALGAVLVQLNHRSADDVVPAAALTPAATVAAAVPAPALPVVQAVPVKPSGLASGNQQKTSPAKVEYAQAATKNVAKTVPPAAAATVDDSLPGKDQSFGTLATGPQPTPKVLCATCGTVETVTPLQREVAPSGAGAAIGAVLGGVLGNQVGGGDGKTLATIAGILGGGFAGNAVEKNMKKETVYEVSVRMEDGSVRRIEQSSPVAVGARVRLDGNTLSPASESPSPAPSGARATI
jgi:outer membrane lipoprotein SlyB